MPEDEVRRTPIVPLTEIVWNVMNINIHHGKSGEMRLRDDRDMSTLHIVMRYVVMYNLRFWLLPALSYWTRSARCQYEQTWNGEIFYNNLSLDEWPLWPGVLISQYLTQFDWDTRIKHGLEIHIWGIMGQWLLIMTLHCIAASLEPDITQINFKWHWVENENYFSFWIVTHM